MSITRRTVARRAVSSTPAFKPDQYIDFNVSIRELYSFVVRLAILHYRSEPRFWVPKPTPELAPRGHAKRPSSSTNLNNLSGLSEFSNSKVSLPKNICQLLDEKLREIAFKKKEYANDEVARRIFLAFYAAFNDETKREIAKSRRVEDLLMKFISTTQKELIKTSDTGLRASSSDTYIGLFCQLLVQILNSNGFATSHANLISQLERYKVSLSINATLRPGASSSNGSITEGMNGLGVNEPPVYPTPSFDIADMSIASNLTSLFGKTSSEVQQHVSDYKQEATLEAAAAEIKAIQRDLRLNNHSIAYQRSDFSSISAYETWKENEMTALDQLIEKFASKKPTLKNTTAAPPGSRCIFTPENPKSFYRLLVDLCFQRDRSMTRDSLILSKESQDLLAKAAAFWRISHITRSRIIILVAEMNYESGFFSLDSLQDEVFPLTDKLEFDPKDNLANSWTKYDKDLSYYTMQKLHGKIVNEIIERLWHIYDTPRPEIGPLLGFIENFVVPGADFDGYPRLDIKPEQIEMARKQVIAAADKKYMEEIDQVPRDLTFSSYHVTQVADVIISRAKLLQKRYKHPLFKKIDVPKVATTSMLTVFGEDSKHMISHIFSIQSAENQTLDFSDLMNLYKKMVEIRYLYNQLIITTPFPFDIEARFEPYFFQHVQSSADVLLEWIEPNFVKDNFLPMEESDGSLISSSVYDIFSSFNGAIKVVSNIEWQNETQLARFYTRTMKGISTGVVNYTELIYNSFQKDLDIDEEAHAKTQYKTRKETWLARARSAVNGVSEIKPFAFKRETCIKLNDIERSIRELDGIETTVDSERQASLLARVNRQEPTAKNFFFSIKIVEATGLKACDTNGLSDPYVTLIMDQKQIARTRTIYEDLNPVWNETFELTISSRKDLILTIWDENAILDHSLCGRSSININPMGFQDFEPQEIWIDLKPQGQILLNISMESERDDIRFYFGKSYRKLMRTETDMVREIVDKFQAFIKYTISLERLRNLSNSRFTMDSVANILKGKAKPKVVEKEEVIAALNPLYTFINANFATLFTSLTATLKMKVMTQTWEVVLDTLELLLIPPLSDKRTTQVALTGTERDNLLIWSDDLLEFFNHDGKDGGVPVEILNSRKRQEFLAAATNFYDWDTQGLKNSCNRGSAQSYQGLRSLRLGPDLVRRNTVMAHRNRRALQEENARLAEVENQSTGTETIILRILRLRGEYDFVARRLQQLSSISRSLAAERHMNMNARQR